MYYLYILPSPSLSQMIVMTTSSVSSLSFYTLWSVSVSYLYMILIININTPVCSLLSYKTFKEQGTHPSSLYLPTYLPTYTSHRTPLSLLLAASTIRTKDKEEERVFPLPTYLPTYLQTSVIHRPTYLLASSSPALERMSCMMMMMMMMAKEDHPTTSSSSSSSPLRPSSTHPHKPTYLPTYISSSLY